MPLLIHVDVPLVNIDMIQSQIQRCCAELGDQLIGRRVYDEFAEVLLVIQLERDKHYYQHVKVLNTALQQRQILSFQSENVNLILVQCHPPQHIRDDMSRFPLQPNESWFPSIADEQTAYLCVQSFLLRWDQENWMEGQHLDYQYI